MFKVGDVVRVKGIRGPEMVVEGDGSMQTQEPWERVMLAYFDAGMELQHCNLHRSLIEPAHVYQDPIFDPEPSANALAAAAYRERVRQELLKEQAEAGDLMRFAHTEGLPNG